MDEELIEAEAPFDPGCCPACGSYIDYCQGHGPSGDPEGAMILSLHDDGVHRHCHPNGCDEVDPHRDCTGRWCNAAAEPNSRCPNRGTGGRAV